MCPSSRSMGAGRDMASVVARPISGNGGSVSCSSPPGLNVPPYERPDAWIFVASSWYDSGRETGAYSGLSRCVCGRESVA
ncbi:hypothetical protein WOLCODRAFT_140576, partial [Wolfiporia cocos MD-104 SS10]